MKSRNQHNVAITGIGLVTPLACSTHETWQALISGQSGISCYQGSELTDYSCKTLGLVTDEQSQLDVVLNRKSQTKTDRFVHLCLLAAHQAMKEAFPDQPTDEQRQRFGTCIGVGIGGLSTVSTSDNLLKARGVKGISPFLIPRTITNMAANWLSMQHQLYGPSIAVTSACSSGGDAIGQAYRMIRDGYVDYMLAGGTESCTIPLAVIAFGNMRALSTWKGDPSQASRPFEKNRSGFVIAEGAGVLVLERYDLAVQKGKTIYAQVVGYAQTSDAYHIAAMHPEGRGAVRALEQALYDAAVEPEHVGYINAHGTGTPMNDVVETEALKKVFGSFIDKTRSKHTLVSSSKSMTGHMIGAAGGVEIGVTALALKNQLAPPTINLNDPDPACDLDYVANQARTFSSDYALSNSFGFGGSNAVVVLKKV